MAYINDIMNEFDDDREWDYSILTKMAKDAGGPESFVENIFDDGNLVGLIEGVAGAVACYGIFQGGKWAYNKIKKWYIEKLNEKLEECQYCE